MSPTTSCHKRCSWQRCVTRDKEFVINYSASSHTARHSELCVTRYNTTLSVTEAAVCPVPAADEPSDDLFIAAASKQEVVGPVWPWGTVCAAELWIFTRARFIKVHHLSRGRLAMDAAWRSSRLPSDCEWVNTYALWMSALHYTQTHSKLKATVSEELDGRLLTGWVYCMLMSWIPVRHCLVWVGRERRVRAAS